ncbi:hypothetical protein OROHE_016465 [Orobanche hederae]
MVRPWFSAEKEKGEGSAVVRFVRVVAAAVMGCFFGCFRIKDSRSYVMSVRKRPMADDKHALSSLFLSDDDSLRNRGKARKPLPEEVDVRELKNEAKFLKACGTLPETPLEFRKASGNRVDTSVESEESLDFNSWLPTASIENLKLQKQPDQSPPPPVKYSEECVTEAGCLVNTPSSCMTDGHNAKRNSVSSIQSSAIQNANTPMDVPDNASHSSAISLVSPVVFSTSILGKNKSVHFECQSDNSTFSSETSCQCSKESGSSGNSSSESKPSPYPTPLKLTGEMQTPGTVFPVYSNNMAGGKANRIRSQYVYSVLNPMENPIIWEDLENENPDSYHSSKSLEPNEEEPLISVPTSSGTLINDLLVAEYGKDEEEFSWFKPQSENQNGENIHFGRTPGDRPILGTVAAHWNDEDSSHITPKWWNGNGIPNSTNKYKEDQKVSWHATPFEERLEKVLSDGTFVSQRKTISGTLPVKFKEAEESAAHLKSIALY